MIIFANLGRSGPNLGVIDPRSEEEPVASLSGGRAACWLLISSARVKHTAGTARRSMN